MALRPHTKIPLDIDLTRGFRVEKFEPVLQRLVPSDVREQCFMHIKHVGFLVDLLAEKCDVRSVGDDLFDNNVRVLRTERKVGAKGRNVDLGADRIDVVHVMPQESEIGPLDHQLLDTDKAEVVWALVKLDVFQNAAGRREMRPVVSGGGDLAVGRLGEFAQNRPLRKRENPDVYESEDAKSDEDHDA